MHEKKKVAVIDNSVDMTGALRAALHYCQYATHQFHFVFILPSGSRAAAILKKSGYEVVELPFLEISKNWKSLLAYLPRLIRNAFRLKKTVKEKNIALVHVNDFYNMAGVTARMLGADFPLITHVRFMPDRFPGPLVRLWMGLNLQFAARIVCVSEAVKKCLPPHPKVQVIYDRLQEFPVVHQLPLPSEKVSRLLYLSHYIPGKGQDLALQAFAEAYQQRTDLRLRFVGGDMGLAKNRMYKSQLENRAFALGLSEVVTFDGPSDNIQQEMLAADIVLNFSESESFSMTCLEALMLGRPLIASDCGGPAELFVHGESGWLVPNRDIRAMSAAILQLTEVDKIREKFSRNSINYVSHKFSEKNTYQHIIETYHVLLDAGCK